MGHDEVDIKEHCPYHPQGRKVCYHVDMRDEKYIKHMICGSFGCVHEWKEDHTKQMTEEFHG